MATSTRRLPARATVPLDQPVPAVGQREPCPCGSGRRYKACHGRAAAAAAAVTPVARPFAGLPGEVDWVALREVVPAATATVRLVPAHRRPAEGELAAVEEATVATVLPLAWPGLRRSDGAVLIGLQTTRGSGDASRDVATALLAALEVAPGTPVAPVTTPGPARLQDVIDTTVPLVVTVHDGFDFWIDTTQELTAEVRASLEQANAGVVPTARLTGVEGAYWCRIGGRTHLRWVLPQDENVLLDAVARLHCAGTSSLGEGTRYLGAFRTHGLLVPVWDLPAEATADDVEQPAGDFGARLQEALDVTTPLTYEERRARAGVVSRQVTLR